MLPRDTTEALGGLLGSESPVQLGFQSSSVWNRVFPQRPILLGYILTVPPKLCVLLDSRVKHVDMHT